MTKNQKRTAPRVSVIAVRAALATLAFAPAAYALDDADRALMQPTSSVEVGIGNVSDHSAKFGEYNGLYDKGAYAIGNFDLKGGAGDASAFRWRITGKDIGLENRNLGAEVGEQGRYRVSYGYDELKRDFADDFKTFYNGYGSTTLTLPANYPAAATRLNLTGTAVQMLSNWANLQSPYATAACATTGGVPTAACQGPGYLIPAAMRNPGDMATKRTRNDAGLSYFITPEWEFKANVRSEHKDGVKLTGYGVNGPGRGLMLPEPIDSTTDNYEAGIGYVGKGGYMNFGYAGSSYRNAINLWTAENPFWGAAAASGALATASPAMQGNIARLTGAPDNQMHQFNMSGGVYFSPKTKLVLAGSYGLSTQNENYNVNYPAPAIIPTTSANAKIINTSFLARLTTKPAKDWNINAAFKYDNRDNQTPSNLYAVPGTDNPVVNCNAAFTSCIPNLARMKVNEPLSRKTQKFSIDADYALNRNSGITLGFERIDLEYYSHAEEAPVGADKSKENTWRLDYRNDLSERWSTRVGYSRSERRIGEYNESTASGNVALPWSPVPVMTEVGTVATLPSGVFWPAADPLLPGYKQFFTANRDRDNFRGAVNFRPTDSLSLDAKLDYNKEKYTDFQYGLKDIKNWAVTLDGAYVASDTLSFNAFYTYEDASSSQNSLTIGRTTVANPLLIAAGYQTASGGVLVPLTAANSTVLGAANEATTCAGSTVAVASYANMWADPCRQWGMTQADQVNTVGLGFKSKGMMGGKLELSGDLVYSRAKTPISVSGGNYQSNGVVTAYAAASSLPDITQTMTDLRLSGKYMLNKASAVRLSYMGRKMASSDWQWDAYANPLTLQTINGTGMMSPNYTVHVLSASYLYSFK